MTPWCRWTTSRTKASSPPSSWPFQVNLLKSEKQPIASTIPEEGATGWADTTMMHADAPHPNCAYKWLEHSLEPEAAGRPRGLVRLGPVGAGRLQGQRAAGRRRAARPTATTISTRSGSGGRRRPSASRRARAFPIRNGPRTTSPSSASSLEQGRRPGLAAGAVPVDGQRHDRQPSDFQHVIAPFRLACGRWTMSSSTSRRASSSPCSGPPARARRPACA